MKLFFKLVLCLFILSSTQVVSQNDGMFKQKKERKRVWRRWRSKKTEYNPYLEKSAKNKPSARIAKGNKKDLRRQKRAAKKQMRRSKKAVNS
ncbi:MAG: hypothetical protein SFY56_01430 [Bacteroidota bacterium]|nr:hypothetical protein [Bacteroidota bacterium]